MFQILTGYSEERKSVLPVNSGSPFQKYSHAKLNKDQHKMYQASVNRACTFIALLVSILSNLF